MHPIVQRRRMGGLTLIEVLIAIVIFAIGLLGIAALQIAGLRYTKGSQTRLVAAMQAETMVDRMHANSTGVADGDYLNPPAMSTNCDTAVCTTTELAAFDTARWLADTRTALGSGPADANVNATVCIDSTPEDGNSAAWACDNSGNIYAIKIEWLERSVERTGAAGGVVDTYGTAAATAGFVSNRFVLRVVP